MTSQIFLHIGAMKTGTTFLQQLMIDNRDQLAAAGYLFPGRPWGRQVRAAQDVLYSDFKDPKLQAATRGAWQVMARQMLDHEGPACIFSMEFLSFAGTAQAERIVGTLAPAPVHVVLTVRDATATIPAHWQTTVRSGRTTSWPDFMQAIRKSPGPLARLTRSADPAFERFRRSQDVARMLGVWRDRLPPERIHVVTVPPRGSDPRLLWDRFAQVVGLDPDAYRSPTSVANTSLGYPSAELLRRVNQELGELLPTDYNPTLRDHLAARVLSQRSSEESGTRLDRATYEFALDWNQRTREAVLDSGASVTGDLEDLPVTPAEDRHQGLDEAHRPPSDAELLAAAQDAVESMHTLVARRARRVRREGGHVDPALLTSVTPEPPAWTRTADPVSAAVVEIARLCRTAVDLRRSFRS
jgi:hypothetical protein